MELQPHLLTMEDCISRLREMKINKGHEADEDYLADVRTVLNLVYAAVHCPEYFDMNVTKKAWMRFKRAMFDSLASREERMYSQDKLFIQAIDTRFGLRQ